MAASSGINIETAVASVVRKVNAEAWENVGSLRWVLWSCRSRPFPSRPFRRVGHPLRTSV